MTIVEMLKRNATRIPEKTAIIYKETKISYREFYESSNALASFLISIGFKKGERVGLLTKKDPQAIISFLGAAAAGGIVFPIDYNQTVADIRYILDLIKPSVLVVAEDFQRLLFKLSPAYPDDRIIVIGKKTKDRCHTWEEILAQDNRRKPEVKVVEDDIVYLNFTSGTTGVPKAAIATHANIYWNTLASIESLKLTSDDIHLCLFPVFGHPHELFARPIYLGGTIVLVDNISPKTIAQAILDHSVTIIMAVASIYETLVRSRMTHILNFSSLRIAESGGMHVNPTLAERFKKCFKISITPVWGSTETMGIALATPVNSVIRPGSTGKICPYYEVKIVGEDGEELGPNEIGEMVIKGAAVSSGYFRNPDETEKCMKDGWFYTGDLLKKDADGYFYFIGRKSGMIKVAGMKVFPIEIEDVLSTHPKIAEIAVVKVQDGLHGEVPKAVIVLNDGVTTDKIDIRKYCAERLSRYKIPRVIQFVPELPKTQGGKILYKKL